MKQTIIAANWKMNKTLPEGKALTLELVEWLRTQQRTDLQIILLPSFIHLTTLHEWLTPDLPLTLGAQNCHEQAAGAFTGEVSSAMLASVGAQYVLVGHSERRLLHHEDHQVLARKVDAALAHGIQPIFCCGEPWEARTSSTQDTYIANQLAASLWHISATQMQQVTIAYEPVWAIGTGQTPDAAAIADMQKAIRAAIASHYTPSIAEGMTVLYGGSCNAKNVKDLVAIQGIDGVLVGNASLQATDFLPLLDAVR